MTIARKPARLTKLSIKEVSLVDRGANPEAKTVFFKRQEVPPLKTGDDKMTVTVEQKLAALEKSLSESTALQTTLQTSNDDLTAGLATANASIAELTKQLKTAKGEKDDDFAGLPESLRKRFEAGEAELKKLRDQQEDAIYIEKAAGFANLTIDASTFGPIMRRVAKGVSTVDDVLEVERVLKAANEAVGQGDLTKSTGAGGEIILAGDVTKKLDAMANEVASKEGIGFAKAYTKVIGEHPDLYKKYLEESRAH